MANALPQNDGLCDESLIVLFIRVLAAAGTADGKKADSLTDFCSDPGTSMRAGRSDANHEKMRKRCTNDSIILLTVSPMMILHAVEERLDYSVLAKSR